MKVQILKFKKLLQFYWKIFFKFQIFYIFLVSNYLSQIVLKIIF